MPREMVIQADLGGITIALTHPLDGAESADKMLDDSLRLVDRARAHQAYVEALVDVRAREERLEQIPAARQALAKERAEERTRMRASWAAQFNARGKRIEFEEGPREKGALLTFDQETENLKRKLDEEEATIKNILPTYRKQAERQKAILDGHSRAEVVLMEGVLAEAAE